MEGGRGWGGEEKRKGNDGGMMMCGVSGNGGGFGGRVAAERKMRYGKRIKCRANERAKLTLRCSVVDYFNTARYSLSGQL